MAEDFIPRNYQVELMKIGLERNTIIFLPTGSGKTFIALMVLKQMSGSLVESYNNGGKITIILVNSVALVDQHYKYIRDHTTLRAGQYTGDMNLDFWPKTKWYDEFNKFQVIIMTCQILVNIVNNNYIDLNKVNLIIFDECHRGVNDQPMRQLMKTFGSVKNQPRVLGLTATLLNGNCKPERVMYEVLSLETTYHSKVATVDGLSEVVGFSTNPTEQMKICHKHMPRLAEVAVLEKLDKIISVVKFIKVQSTPLNLKGLKPLEPTEGYKKLANVLVDLKTHIETTGSYGGYKSALAHLIQIERLKKHCQDLNFFNVLCYVQTNMSLVQELLKSHMKNCEEKDMILNFSSHKILTLLEIFREYKLKSKEDLCCLVFTKRRFTAKIIYFILESVARCIPEFSHIKSNFMVGYNNNPYNDTREALYTSKKNKQVLESFCNKEINVLVASNVLEEGVDIPKCTLVIKYDKPEDYRSYIQSKGRARHKDSLFYMIVESDEYDQFIKKYREFQLVEQTLNDYLIGKNTARYEPSKEAIENMYNEDELPPYYVDGYGSAQVNMTSAIPLLCQYCSSLPSDVYTNYAPEWYVKEKFEGANKKIAVVILMPTVCPISDLIEGAYMNSTKSAKRAAALKTCILLHQAKELDDHLLPRRRGIVEEDVSFLFTHYPKVKEENAGNTSNKRLHRKQIPQFVQGQLKPNTTHFLHIIQLNPSFLQKSEDINESTMYDMYTSPLCFGLVTPNALPFLCDFPIYVTLGKITVSLAVNQQTVSLTSQDINDMRKFHLLVFDDLLKILKSFLIFDNSDEAEMLLLVPVNKHTSTIDFDAMRKYTEVKNVLELTMDEKLNLEVTQDTHLKTIVSPWYRRDLATYIVTEVSLNKNAYSDFPNEDYGSFVDYFREKHGQRIVNPTVPLLLVKGLTKRLTFIKPKGREGKRKRDKVFEEMAEYLIPELVVKQDFPGALWIQASLLPTVISRITYLLQLEQLRCTISKESGLGWVQVNARMPLELDQYLLDYEPYVMEEPVNEIPITIDNSVLSLPPAALSINKDFATKMLEAEFPWKDIEEPKDIERDLDVNMMDIEHYENFISFRVKDKNDYILRNSPVKTNQLALTYHKNFVPKSIKLLNTPFSNKGPELCEIYRALTAAKANDIVNLERLETLGDSFLKLISSIYITFRFPKYDEGKATELKGRIVSNKNLFYLATEKKLGGIMKFNELSPKEEWLPPAFAVPMEMLKRIEQGEISTSSLFHLAVPVEEQLSGKLSADTLNEILNEDYEAVTDSEHSIYCTMASFLKCQYIGDKHVADVVEALIGVYFKSCGFKGGIRMVEWLGIIPKSEHLENLLKNSFINPLLDASAGMDKINFHLPLWRDIESILGYNFKNRAFLLQALTHSSYTPNRITLSYEKLEFLGDAVLDFLITCYIYESCGNLNPGQLTDLRSALVNNNTFASLFVRCGLHKFLLMINSKLQGHIDKFTDYLKQKNYQIDDEVLILLEEDELNLAEYVDVPKVLGDVFEAIAGAIYLDSGKDLNVVWAVFYKIMWKEIELFSQKVPKSIIRRLYEWPGSYPKFGQALITSNNKCMVPLRFMLRGREKIVHGCGTNKAMAKRAAAKLALRSLEME